MSTANPKSRSILNSGAGFLKNLVYEDAPTPRDHRRENRQPVAGEVIVIEVDGEGKRSDSHRVFIRDLSIGGCGLWSRVRLEAGATVMVVFQGPDGQAVHRMSTVQHCRGHDRTGFAVGIRFIAEGNAKK